MLGLHKNQQTSVENITLFAQIARLIPRFIVEEAAKKFKSNKGASRLDTWTHLLSMIFCHIGNCLSLRDITNGMRSAGGNLNHMGIGSAPSRNALSHQNRQRNCEVWKYLYKRLHDYLGRQSWGRRIKLAPLLRHTGGRFLPPRTSGCVTILYHAGRCNASHFLREFGA